MPIFSGSFSYAAQMSRRPSGVSKRPLSRSRRRRSYSSICFFVIVAITTSPIYKNAPVCKTDTPKSYATPLRGQSLICIKFCVLLSYTLLISVFPTVPSLVNNSETSAGVKNSPPDFPALDAYIVIKYS